MPNESERNRAIHLIRILIGDVIAARERLNMADTQTARRDVVRASLAAIEGEVWLARDHVRDTLRGFDELSPLANLALSEQAYVVTENGKLLEQTRSVPLPTAVRLVVAQTQIICPELAVDFAGTGWSNFRRAVSIRNRITHPRPENDLNVSDEELHAVASGLSWLAATIEYIMASTNLALIDARTFLDQLLAGNADALEKYQSELERGA